MAEPRWYPTATQLPDGRVLTFAGDRIVQDRPGQPPPFSDASVNSLPELYNPTTNTWTSLTSAPADLAALSAALRPLGRPHPRRRPGHDHAHPDAGDVDVVDASATSPFDGHSAVMYRPNKIMKSGTWADPDFQGAARLRHARAAPP